MARRNLCNKINVNKFKSIDRLGQSLHRLKSLDSSRTTNTLTAFFSVFCFFFTFHCMHFFVDIFLPASVHVSSLFEADVLRSVFIAKSLFLYVIRKCMIGDQHNEREISKHQKKTKLKYKTKTSRFWWKIISDKSLKSFQTCSEKY